MKARLWLLTGLLCGASCFAQERPADKAKITSYQCNCTDRPTPHYPYTVVVVSAPEGEVVARPEGNESAFRFVPLAIRFGERYCDVDAHEQCYGNFAHPCEFTDHRYGATLAPYFPTCKTLE